MIRTLQLLDQLGLGEIFFFQFGVSQTYTVFGKASNPPLLAMPNDSCHVGN